MTKIPTGEERLVAETGNPVMWFQLSLQTQLWTKQRAVPLFCFTGKAVKGQYLFIYLSIHPSTGNVSTSMIHGEITATLQKCFANVGEKIKAKIKMIKNIKAKTKMVKNIKAKTKNDKNHKSQDKMGMMMMKMGSSSPPRWQRAWPTSSAWTSSTGTSGLPTSSSRRRSAAKSLILAWPGSLRTSTWLRKVSVCPSLSSHPPAPRDARVAPEPMCKSRKIETPKNPVLERQQCLGIIKPTGNGRGKWEKNSFVSGWGSPAVCWRNFTLVHESCCLWPGFHRDSAQGEGNNRAGATNLHPAAASRCARQTKPWPHQVPSTAKGLLGKQEIMESFSLEKTFWDCVCI